MFIFALVVAVVVFIGFLSLVGSPSEVETIIGLVIAAIAGLAAFILAWRFKSGAHEADQNERIAELEKEIERLRKAK